MIVHLNSHADSNDGWVNVYVDEKKLISHEKLRFRVEINNKSAINKFLFNTFHGGSSREWTPLNAQGESSVECAYFDNIFIY